MSLLRKNRPHSAGFDFSRLCTVQLVNFQTKHKSNPALKSEVHNTGKSYD